MNPNSFNLFCAKKRSILKACFWLNLTVALIIATFFCTVLYRICVLQASTANKTNSTTPNLCSSPSIELFDRFEKELEVVLQRQVAWFYSETHKEVNTSTSYLARTAKSMPKLHFTGLPKSMQINNSMAWKMAEQESNIAATYWERWLDINWRYPKYMKHGVTYCNNVKLTDPFLLNHFNLYWQVFFAEPENSAGHSIVMYLYNAYYDNRVSHLPVVKLITMNNQEPLGQQRNWSCLLWFEHIVPPVLVSVTDYYNVWPPYWEIDQKMFQAQLITCPIPEAHANDVPRAVSLQARSRCDQVQQNPENVLRVVYNKRPNGTSRKGSIGVCVQALRFGAYDISVRLVEWLETVKLLGASKVYMYAFSMTDNMTKVVQHYQKEDFVDLRPLTLPGHQINNKWLYNLFAYKQSSNFWPSEILELNDCLYRNLYRHQYLAVLDLDEMIVPQLERNWIELADAYEKKYGSKGVSFVASPHAYIGEESEELQYRFWNIRQPIPSYLYMMRHTLRGNIFINEKTKSIVWTDRVSALHNHFPLRCLGTSGYHKCPGYIASSNRSLLLHFRRGTKYYFVKGRFNTRDHSMWRYFNQLESKVTKQLVSIFSN